MQRDARRDWRERGAKFVRRAEWIALALEDEYRHADARQVRGAQPIRSAGWVQRITEQHDAGDAERLGILRCREMRGDAAAHRLAADENLVASEVLARRGNRRAVARVERRRAIRHAPFLFGVQKVEGQDVDAALREGAREIDHERALLRRAGAVREDERGIHARVAGGW